MLTSLSSTVPSKSTFDTGGRIREVNRQRSNDKNLGMIVCRLHLVASGGNDATGTGLTTLGSD